MTHASLVWFRQDLRLDDNPALTAAVERGEPIIPVYIRSPEEEGRWRMGAASRWWLHRSLQQLDQQLEELDSKLILCSGPAETELLSLIQKTGADAVYWNRRYEPASSKHDSHLKAKLQQHHVHVEVLHGQLLFEPDAIQTKQGRPYQVFTAFWNSCLAQPEPDEPAPAPRKLLSPQHWPASIPLKKLELNPRIQWDAGLSENWEPGSVSAHKQLNRFLKGCVSDYQTARDLPAERGTSRLSPHLHFGEISPRTIWHETKHLIARHSSHQAADGASTFLKEIGWREFANHLLVHFPQTPEHPLHEEFSRFPWEADAKRLNAWHRGLTGYPIVDAGMRELWTTGWMHNRVRMIVASFLVKDLLIQWQRGAEWFWDTLVDADLANNTLGWQWSAGCGADAAPYFRVFNPVLQSKKFDPNGEYLTKWIPELTNLPAQYRHAPWTASESVLHKAGVELGKTYPQPIVDHDQARLLALDAFRKIRSPAT